MSKDVRACLAEGVGTFLFVLVGAGAVVMDAATGGQIGLLGIALAHGLILAAMVSATMHVSGGHLNPAVTLGVVAAGKQPLGLGIAYIISQLAGCVVAGAVLWAVCPEPALFGANFGAPSLGPDLPGGAWIAVVLEAIMTLALVLAVFGTGVDQKAPRNVGGFAIGLTYAACILFGGPLTGAALNPARALGPAVMANSWDAHWVYWVGPIVGGVVAGLLYQKALAAPEAE